MLTPRERFEYSAGVALVRDDGARGRQVLLVRIRRDVWELPKGHLEGAETAEEAARRELLEETGLSAGDRAEELGSVVYTFELQRGGSVTKHVTYFVARESGEPPARKPDRTRELRWVTRDEAAALPMPSEDLRALVLEAFERDAPMG
jgi:8-oxo-dGTP pyrophosphatase MutT (NUDIX family)